MSSTQNLWFACLCASHWGHGVQVEFWQAEARVRVVLACRRCIVNERTRIALLSGLNVSRDNRVSARSPSACLCSEIKRVAAKLRCLGAPLFVGRACAVLPDRARAVRDWELVEALLRELDEVD